MDLSEVNLNLLVAFDALLKESGHVTRAGQRLHITQPAMSGLLKQLRVIFNDELFVRGRASSMIPTPKAKMLARPLSELLGDINQVLQLDNDFIPHQSKYSFTLGASDYAGLVVTPVLMDYLAQHAPGIQIHVRHCRLVSEDDLDRVDFLIGAFEHVSERLVQQKLCDDRFVCVGRKDHPLLDKPVSKRDFEAARKIVVPLEEVVHTRPKHSNIIVLTDSILKIVYALQDTQLIAMLPQRIADYFMRNFPITSAPFVDECDKVPAISLVWHPKNKFYPPHQWMRNVLRDELDY